MSKSDNEAEEAEKQRLADHYFRAAGGKPVGDFRQTEIDYIDIAPAPFEVKLPLVEYFERIKRHKADEWQHDFCQRLEDACVGRHQDRTWNVVHAEGQLGKSSILAQCFPAWILGHDPLHRIALSTYNVTRSQAHAKVVVGIMQSTIHKDIFPNPEGLLPKSTAVSGWNTNARIKLNEAQFSYNPVGLQSGLTGSGFDTLIIDDPYADQKEAFSETVRQNLQDFWDFTIGSRIGLYANVFAMFHRYHVQDLAGYLLDTGDFDYVRYATMCDGPYIHDETGQKFDDPLNREIGEYVSPERRSPEYYKKSKQKPRVWNSMFQGRPSSEEGDFFNVGKIKIITAEKGIARRQECVAMARAWDNAATEDGGDTTAGILAGIRADGGMTIFDAILVQADSAGRLDEQKRAAEADGRDVTVCIPQDPGSAGKDVLFFTEQHLEGFTVVARPTSQKKTARALNFSYAVNDGQVEMVKGDWNKRVLTSLRDFPLSNFDDPVDAGADAYNHLYEVFRKGLVIKNFRPQRNLTPWNSFSSRFGNCEKVPANFTIYVGVKITPDASRPNSSVIVGRAPQNANMPDTLFLIAEYKKWTADFYDLFTWIDSALAVYCANAKDAMIWLHPDSESYKQTIWQKLQRPVSVFEGDEFAGITELDWYLLPRDSACPFNEFEKATGLYGLVAAANQMAAATDEYGLYAFRQEAATWGFNDKGQPSAIGAVLECLRMVTYCFRTVPAALTKTEKIEAALAPTLRVDALAQMENSPEKDSLLTRRNLEVKKAQKDMDKPIRGAHATRFARR